MTTQVSKLVANLAETMLDANVSLDELRDAMFIEASKRAANTTEAANLLGICMKSGYNHRNRLQRAKLFHYAMIGSKKTHDRPIGFNEKRLF